MKKKRLIEKLGFICPHCGYDCHYKEGLERHIEWAHKDKK